MHAPTFVPVPEPLILTPVNKEGEMIGNNPSWPGWQPPNGFSVPPVRPLPMVTPRPIPVHRASLPPPITVLPQPPSSTITLRAPRTASLGRNHPFRRSAPNLQHDQHLDHSHLKPGNRASLLPFDKTIEMYSKNCKKTDNPELHCEFASFLIDMARTLSMNDPSRARYFAEAEKTLKQQSSRGHAESQFLLGNLYASGLMDKKGKHDFDKAFPLYTQAAKHHHPGAVYRAGKCYEDGLGCYKDHTKAIQYYKKSAKLSHPGAMYRLGVAQIKGELGMSRNSREGVNWLKRSAELATRECPYAIHELASFHEIGLDNVIFADHVYALSLYIQAAELGHAPSAYRLGECYEFGQLGCPIDPQRSFFFYSEAAAKEHRDACFALTSWYLVGSPGVVTQSDSHAFMWTSKAAQMGLPRAEYALGYFCEMGIGCSPNPEEAMQWYSRAAQQGDKRAIQRLRSKSSHPHRIRRQMNGGIPVREPGKRDAKNTCCIQ